MRKLFCVLLCLALCVIGAALAEENGGAFTPASDFEFLIENGECTVTGYTGEAAEVSIPPEIGGFPVTGIGYRAFYCRGGLTAVTIPEGVTSIGIAAFFDCENLESVTIPEGVTTVAREAFAFCSGLTEITLPESVTSIEEYAFYFCENLESVAIPEGVTAIGAGTFGRCENLLSATIPAGVTAIDDYAFADCESLQTILGAPDSFAQTWAEERGHDFGIFTPDTPTE